jgi:hypothetical protein
MINLEFPEMKLSGTKAFRLNDAAPFFSCSGDPIPSFKWIQTDKESPLLKVIYPGVKIIKLFNLTLQIFLMSCLCPRQAFTAESIKHLS